MQTEHVILLNAQGVPTGTLEKYAAHTADTRLHLAFSSWLFNAKGQLLVTRRALSKKAWPGVWTNSVCGHPQLGVLWSTKTGHRVRVFPVSVF
jgi:isopentenyl-diphosphate delta-isomerase